MHHRWEFSAKEVRGVTAARREFAAHLREMDSSEARVHASSVIFGELIANAVKYGCDPISATLIVGNGRPLLVVEDGGGGFEAETLRVPQPTDQGGRGFRIASLLAHSLRCERLANCFRITVELPIEYTPNGSLATPR